MSTTIAAGGWNAPTRFLPAGRSTPVLPPIAESIWATRVVGTWMIGTPRSQLAARNPAASPSAPPPIATSGSPRSARSAASAPAASSITASDFAASPCGSRIRSIGQPSSASAAAIASPAAAQAPGSETRIARRARSPRSASPTTVAAIPSPIDEVAAERAAAQEDRRLRVADRPRHEVVRALDDRGQLGDAVEPVGRRVEPLAVAGEVADRAHRVAADDQRPDVRRATEALGEDLRADVEPDRHAAPVERPAIARIDDGAAAGRDDRPDAGSVVGRAELGDRLALEGPERVLAVARRRSRGSARRPPSRSTSSRSTNAAP